MTYPLPLQPSLFIVILATLLSEFKVTRKPTKPSNPSVLFYCIGFYKLLKKSTAFFFGYRSYNIIIQKINVFSCNSNGDSLHQSFLDIDMTFQ